MAASFANISDFLSENGLSRLLDLFAREDVDMSVLPLLDNDDLKELGLTLGQRKKLLAAVKTLNDAAVPLQAPKEAPIQLRRISVMFCDIVGSTHLSGVLSIEEMQSVFQHYYNIANDIAQEHDGYVVGTQGDGVVILFGYPRVLDGLAERCVQAAQELQVALADNPVIFEGKEHIHISTRIGIATGQAAVGQGDNVLPGNPMQLVGPVVNRAARLQTVAQPLSIAVDIKTQELTKRSVQYSQVEKHDLKGLPSGVEVFHVQGLRHSDEKPKTPKKLIGREAETDTLRALWIRAKKGALVTATVTGDAGIGKSSLIQSFVAEHTGHAARVLELRCSAMGTQSPLRPVTKALVSLIKAGTADLSLATLLGDPTPKMLQRTIQFLGLGTVPQAEVSISMHDRDRILNLLSDWIINGRARPTLLVLENAQWADDSTRELMTRVAERAKDASPNLFLLAVSRDNSENIWASQTGHKALRLPPLGAVSSRTLIQDIFGANPVAQSIRDNILRNSGGNPLMLETLARAQIGQKIATVTSAVEVPHTIYESVSKRLDGIESGRRVIEALAVLNRPADQSLIAAVLEQTTQNMAPAINALEQAGLVTHNVDAGVEVISIIHQVYRDVIYEQIVGQSRRRLHAAAYSALRASDADNSTVRQDVLATHADYARDWANVAVHALNAGENTAQTLCAY